MDDVPERGYELGVQDSAAGALRGAAARLLARARLGRVQRREL